GLDRQLKERVVGAVVVIVAAIIFVPMILDGQQEQSAGERDLPLPAPSVHARSIETFDTRAPNLTTAVSKSNDRSPKLNQEDRPTSDDSTAKLVEVPSAVKDSSNDDTSTKELITNETIESSVVNSNANNTPVNTAIEQAVKPGIGSGWVVQVGSFREQQNAERLADELKKLSYPSFVTRHSGPEYAFYRVRVGPEPDRDRAAVLAKRLKKEGQVVAVVPFP
ncbi:MAG: SPOR domain-containing protein, partial [Gammaproteobacteria bacterium]|nr:SPOR domain-containing protein [Gammaproteobacteria bacterium]